MKNTPKQFALALYESLEDGKSASEVKVVIKSFVELLAKQGRLGQEEEIIKEFVKIWNEKRGIKEAEVTSAQGLDKESVKLIRSYIAELSGVGEVALNEKIDEYILGGVVIKYEDKILDGSLKTQLGALKEKMIK